MRTTANLSTLIVTSIFTLAAIGCGSSDPGTETPAASISGGIKDTASGGANSIAAPPAPTDPDRYNAKDIASRSDSESYRSSTTDDPQRYDGPDIIARANAARDAEGVRNASENPIVAVKTSLGTFKIQLDPQSSPVTVENFLEYVRSGFYSGTIFHQAENGFIVAAGGYQSNLNPKRTRLPIRNEAHNGLRNLRGTVAMVRDDRVDSATSQFLINLADNLSLDHRSRAIAEAGQPDEYGYCVFGRIVSGWDVVQRIAQSRVQRTSQFRTLPTQPITIVSAEVLATGRTTTPKSQAAEVSSTANQRNIK